MLIEVACCVMLQTHPRLINWLNPALVKAAAWIYWVGYTLGNGDLWLLSELQTAGVEVANKKNLLSLFLAAKEGMVKGKAIHIRTIQTIRICKNTDTELTFRLLFG